MLGFCFKLALGAGLAAVLFAGDAGVARPHLTSVVRTDPHSGKLVRSVIVSPKVVSEQHVAPTVVAPHVVTSAIAAPAPPPAPTGIDEAVEKVAAQQSLLPELLHSVIKVESNYNPYAVSPKGALGLMQLIPSTARRFGVSDVFNPMENIQGGAKYLKHLMDLYNNDYELALAAYNAGEGAVAKYGTVPPYRETRDYVHRVADQLKKSKARPAKPKPEVKPAETAQSGPQEPNHITRVVEADGTVRYVTR